LDVAPLSKESKNKKYPKLKKRKEKEKMREKISFGKKIVVQFSEK